MVVTRSQTKSQYANPTTQGPGEAQREDNSPPRLRERAEPQPSGSHQAAHISEGSKLAAGATTNIAQQETTVLPASSGLQHQPHGNRGQSTYTRRSSSSSILAKKLAIEAEIQQRRVERECKLAEREREREQREREREQRDREREREIALQQQKADELELCAKLASLEAHSDRSGSVSSRSSHKERVTTWVGNQNAPNMALDPQPRVLRVQAPVGNTATCGAEGDPIVQLAKAFSSLPDRPRKPELIPFTGNIDEWLAFKCTYERTKTFFTPAENLARLTSAVRGAARAAISSILWQAQDPEEVVTALEKNYARPEQLVAHEIAGLRGIKIGNAEHLNILANKLRNCVAIIKLFQQHEYLSSLELLRTVLLKLNEHTRDRFTDYAATHKPFEPTVTKLELLSRFLVIEAERQLNYNFLVDVTPSSSQSKAPFYKPNVTKDLNVHATTSNDKTTQCAYCKQGPHSVKTCKAFSSLSVDDRWRWIKETKTCYRCLKSSPHTWNTCQTKRCGVSSCDRRHHALLHGDKSVSNSNLSANNTVSLQNSPKNDTIAPPQADGGNVVANTIGVPAAGRRGLLKILPVTLEGLRGTFDTFALLDEGSTATLIDGDVAARIGADTTDRQKLRVTGVGGMYLDTEVCFVNFYIRGRDMPERHLVQGARSFTPLCLTPQSTDMLDLSKYNHLLDLSAMLEYQDATPTVLVGAADWHLSLSREMRVGKKNEPVASRTLLGWVLHGAMSSSTKPVDFVNNVCEVDYASRTINSLEALIKKQYEVDSLGIQKLATRQNNDDARAVSLVESSAQRLASGRFEVGLPWKERLTNDVPDSYPHALSRLKSLEKQMAKDSTLALAYKKYIESIVQKGYAEECAPSTFHDNFLRDKSSAGASVDGTHQKSSAGVSLRWYLPHFGVYHPQKRKLRVVYDAAAVTRGVSLNEMLLQGPDLLQSLLNILFRFREGPIAFNADIREMFLQIKMKENDRDALRFLWRNGNSQDTVKEYRMTSLIFGAVSSPFIAMLIKNKNAKEFEHKYPAATHAIIHNHYMDDYIGSEFNLPDAKRLASDIVTVHNFCGFEMRSWVSNVPEALALVPKELCSDSNSDVNLPLNNDVGALGVKWNPLNDTLGFRTCRNRSGVCTITKRSLLSSVMSVYDPLGLIMPIVIQGRILIQKLWREGTDWDSPIPPKYEVDCKSWFDQIDSAANLRIPRWYVGKSEQCSTQLHVIADGGEQAYACVAYWRYAFVDGSVSLALIGSKARVAPLKPLSIPRLELQAALIATRFAQTILNAHRTQPSAVFYWTDSTTVLKWIRSDARCFKPFVAHRLGEILEFTNPSNWKWLPSELNIADDATKPKHFEFTSSHRWFAGPSFLINSPSEWPHEPEHIIDEVLRTSELKPEYVGLLVDNPLLVPPVPDAARFSSWLRLLRSTARVFQAVRKFWSKSSSPNLLSKSVHDTTSPSHLSADDILQAEKMLFSRIQIDSFSEELKILKASQPVPKTSRIAALAPVLDKDGLIRLYSRIKSAPGVSESVKSPIILDGRHRIVHLIILHKHAEAGHGNHELVLNEIRQTFWILRARATIRSIAKGCLQCRRQNGRLVTPATGDLPPERLDHHTRPFTHVGLDYFGPIEVAIGRRREKRWVALYTCLVTRALHLEVVASLSSSSAIMSLRRLISRRGTPATIFCDNATCFVGAKRELASLYDEAVENFATSRKISWRFIPPASPFMGGAWERLVRSVKTALRVTLKDRAPREEVLTTLLIEAESIVNSRPLTYVPNSPDAPEAITPFHFILGSSSVTSWPCKLPDADSLRATDWRLALRLAEHFWARWLAEYLPTLIPRGRNRSESGLCEGDVVLIADNTLPRGLWLLGRINKTFPGPDGLVRVADVATKGGILRRPVRKLLPLVAHTQPVATRV